MRIFTPSILFLLAVSTGFAMDMPHAHHGMMRPDGHAPIGVMGGHTHGKGKAMLSYRFMRMGMDGMRQGTNSLSSAEVLGQGYMASPTKMEMNMHMLGGMYGLTDNITLMAMGSYIEKDMDHQRANGTHFQRTSRGVGDSKVSALFSMGESGQHRVVGQVGVSLPTGSVDETDPTGAHLPYPMQLGSGTYDALAGVTYSGKSRDYSWGAQARTTIRLGDNENDYRLGNVYGGTAWLARKVNNRWSVSARAEGQYQGKISGRDTTLNASMVPTADPDNQGGTTVQAGLGVNMRVPAGALKGHRFSAEVMLPVYQNLNGPQMQQQYGIMVGWQKGF